MPTLNSLSIVAAVAGALLCSAGAQSLLAAPVKGGTLTIAQDESPDRIDPHFSVAVQHRLIVDGPYEALLEIDTANNNALVPSLATEWKQESPTSYLFTIREGVKFHDGSTMTVDDVVFTFQRIMDPAVPSSSRIRMAAMKSVAPVGTNQVRIELKSPSASFLSMVGDPAVSAILSRKFTTANNNDLATIVNGTGAFRVTRFQPGVGIVMERNPEYWREGLPHLDKVEIRIVPDDSTRIALLRTGEIDMTLFRPDKLPLIERLTGVVTSPNAYNAPEFVKLNCLKPPFDKKEVRQALSLSLDRGAIGATVMPNAYKLGMWIPPGDKVFGYQGDGMDVPLQKRDVARAKELLAAAGYPNGGVESAVEFIGSPAFQIDARISEVMERQAAEAGFELTLAPTEFSTFLATSRNGEFQLKVSGRGQEIDPDLTMVHEIASFGSSAQCKDPKVDEMILAEQRELDISKRAAIIDQLQRYLSEEAYLIYLFHMPLRVEVWKEHVKDYKSNMLLRRTSLREAYVEK